MAHRHRRRRGPKTQQRCRPRARSARTVLAPPRRRPGARRLPGYWAAAVALGAVARRAHRAPLCEPRFGARRPSGRRSWRRRRRRERSPRRSCPCKSFRIRTPPSRACASVRSAFTNCTCCWQPPLKTAMSSSSGATAQKWSARCSSTSASCRSVRASIGALIGAWMPRTAPRRATSPCTSACAATPARSLRCSSTPQRTHW
mmetsp:Transcript_98910/g.248036  ORF Transcript_98910/g.248036 Transcript_98910/m.248036 type:complete len:202 (-) Transcript_98910:542-1147(-)